MGGRQRAELERRVGIEREGEGAALRGGGRRRHEEEGRAAAQREEETAAKARLLADARARLERELEHAKHKLKAQAGAAGIALERATAAAATEARREKERGKRRSNPLYALRHDFTLLLAARRPELSVLGDMQLREAMQQANSWGDLGRLEVYHYK